MSVKRTASSAASMPDEDNDSVLFQPPKKHLRIDVSDSTSIDAAANTVANDALSQIAEMAGRTSPRLLSAAERDSFLSVAMPTIELLEEITQDSPPLQASNGGSTISQGQGYKPCREESPPLPASSNHGGNFPTIEFFSSPQLPGSSSPYAMLPATQSAPSRMTQQDVPPRTLKFALKKIIKMGHPQTVYKSKSPFNTENLTDYRNFLFPLDPKDEPFQVLVQGSGISYLDCARELASPQINSNPEKDQDHFGWSQVNAFGRQFRGVHLFTLGYFDCHKCMIENNQSKAFTIKTFNLKPSSQFSLAQKMALDEVVDYLLLRYSKTRLLGLRIPEIYNRNGIKKDGCIIEEYTDPMGADVPWENKDTLLPQEKQRLESFCDVLEVAIENSHKIRWNLAPGNFAILPDGALALSNLTELCFKKSWDQWDEFHRAIIKWIGHNPEAKAIVIDRLQEIGGSNLRSWSPEMVRLTTRLLSEEAPAPMQLEPFGSEVPWKNKETLSDEEQSLLRSFCKCLKTAFENVDQSFWDLDPKHFKKTSAGTVELSRLIEFSPNEEEPLDSSRWDQWKAFEKAISKWIGGNDEARTIVALELDKVAEDCFNYNEKIIGLKNKVVEGYVKMPWAEKNTLSRQEKILLDSFCENLVGSVLKIKELPCIEIASSLHENEIPWDYLYDKINRWAANNHKARTVLISELLETKDAHALESLSGPILYLGTRLLEGYGTLPWQEKQALSPGEKKLFASFCSILKETIKGCRKGKQEDWENLYSVIKKWAMDNREAKEIVIANLENIIDDDDAAPELVSLKNRLESEPAPS